MNLKLFLFIFQKQLVPAFIYKKYKKDFMLFNYDK